MDTLNKNNITTDVYSIAITVYVVWSVNNDLKRIICQNSGFSLDRTIITNDTRQLDFKLKFKWKIKKVYIEKIAWHQWIFGLKQFKYQKLKINKKKCSLRNLADELWNISDKSVVFAQNCHFLKECI